MRLNENVFISDPLQCVWGRGQCQFPLDCAVTSDIMEMMEEMQSVGLSNCEGGVTFQQT